MSHKEFQEWQVYYTLEPWGTEPEDRRAALVASTIANVNRPRRSKAFRVDDFMPRYGRKPKRQTWQEQLAIAKQWTAAKG